MNNTVQEGRRSIAGPRENGGLASAAAGSTNADLIPQPSQPNVLHCFICKEPPKDPISTSCGHVFCWPCLGQGLENSNQPKPCPVCRHSLRRDHDIIPLFVDGEPTFSINETPADTRSSTLPPRPRNPLLGMTSRTPDGLGSENHTAGSFMTSLPSEIEAYQFSINRLSASLDNEQSRATSLNIARVELIRTVAELERQNRELRRQLQLRFAVQDRERHLFEDGNSLVQSRIWVDRLESRIRDLQGRNSQLAREVGASREREQRLSRKDDLMAERIRQLQTRLDRL